MFTKQELRKELVRAIRKCIRKSGHGVVILRCCSSPCSLEIFAENRKRDPDVAGVVTVIGFNDQNLTFTRFLVDEMVEGKLSDVVGILVEHLDQVWFSEKCVRVCC